jgi:GTP-binding protein HflX
VWNKIDRLDPDAREELANDAARCDRSCILVSAATGEGISDLLAAIDSRLGARDDDVHVLIEPGQGRLLSWIHANAQVLDQASGDDGHIDLHVRIAAEKRGQLERQMKLAARGKPVDRAR